MVKFTIELDDGTAERLAAASRARHVSIEDILRLHAESVAEIESAEIPGRSHRKILSALERPEGYYESSREEMYDRESGRAAAYKAARDKLLALIDGTQADMGQPTWNRAALYDR